jgi:hypothetical protein
MGVTDKALKASRLTSCSRVVALGALTFILGLLAGSSSLGNGAPGATSAGERGGACATPVGSASTDSVHYVPALYERYAVLLEGVITGRLFPEQGACSDLECCASSTAPSGR